MSPQRIGTKTHLIKGVYITSSSFSTTPHAIGLSTLVNMYNKIIGSTVNIAQDHINLSDSLSTQVVDVLKALETKYEDNGKKASCPIASHDPFCSNQPLASAILPEALN